METEHPETVVEKTVAFVKDVLGIHSAPGPEYRETASEVTAENAMRLDPNEFALGRWTPRATSRLPTTPEKQMPNAYDARSTNILERSAR